MRKLIFILFVLLEFSLSWAGCVYLPDGYFQGDAGNCGAYVRGTCGNIICDRWNNYTGCPSYVSNRYNGNFVYYVSSVECQSLINPFNASCNWSYRCDSKNDADSLNCFLSGGRWEFNDFNGMYECNTSQCDSTFTCITYPYNYCNDVQNDLDITCVNGNCWGIGGAKWVSYYDRNCINECGATENTRVSGDTVFVPGGSCDDPINCDPTTYCSDFENGTYFLYQVCLIGREVVGNVDERQTMTQITYSGVGTCKDNGYSSKTYPNSGGGNRI